MRIFHLIGPVLACFLFMAGCGSQRVSVKGQVTYDGKPVEEGSISFEPVDGNGPTLGGKIEAGRFEVSGPMEAAGKKLVRIRANHKTGRKIEAGMPAPKGTLVDEIVNLVPSQYNDKSSLTTELATGKKTEQDFHLPAAKGP